jgi:hydroxymethylpyrimidine pyrophosphatase-like HAD family hydrolase
MIRLLSTDFDGTLVDHFATPPVAPELFAWLERLHRCGVFWAVNTGRDLGFALDGLREFQFPVEPDYILTNEREIFHRNPQGEWHDYGDWNRRCILAHDRLFQTEAPFLDEMLRFVRDETGAQPIYENDRPVGLCAQDDGEMDRVIAHLHAIRKPGSLFHYQRNTIYLRFCHADYSKGAALGELCRLARISAGETFTAGDHHNDLSMLDGRFARWPAAPGNAIDEVKEAVTKAGGYVAQARCSDGVMEALCYFFETLHLAPPGFEFNP